MRVDYNRERLIKVRVCGIECDFGDMRIDRNTVPEGRCQYEIANDGENQWNPRI